MSKIFVLYNKMDNIKIKELGPHKNIGRRKYTNEEERVAAKKKSASEYYQRNRDRINQKNIDHYTKTKYLQVNDIEHHYNSKYYRQYILNENKDMVPNIST